MPYGFSKSVASATLMMFSALAVASAQTPGTMGTPVAPQTPGVINTPIVPPQSPATPGTTSPGVIQPGVTNGTVTGANGGSAALIPGSPSVGSLDSGPSAGRGTKYGQAAGELDQTATGGGHGRAWAWLVILAIVAAGFYVMRRRRHDHATHTPR